MKPALVISGGGSKGAFAVGAVRYMRRQLGIEFGLVAGTSTGAMISPFVVCDDLELLEQVYTSVNTASILKEVSVDTTWDDGYLFDTTPLENLVSLHLDAARSEKVLDSSIPAFLVTTCLQTGRLTYFQTGQFAGQPEGNSDYVRLHDRDGLINAVVASSNQPVFMPPVWYPPDKQPIREYVDGGVREYAPINIAITNGATDIYVILHSPPASARQPKVGQIKGLKSILLRTIGLLTDEVGANDLRLAQVFSEATLYLETIRRNARTLGLSNEQITQLFAGANPFTGRRPVNLIIIRPEKDFPTEGLEFEPTLMKSFVEWGARRAQEVLGPPK